MRVAHVCVRGCGPSNKFRFSQYMYKYRLHKGEYTVGARIRCLLKIRCIIFDSALYLHNILINKYKTQKRDEDKRGLISPVVGPLRGSRPFYVFSIDGECVGILPANSKTTREMLAKMI